RRSMARTGCLRLTASDPDPYPARMRRLIEYWRQLLAGDSSGCHAHVCQPDRALQLLKANLSSSQLREYEKYGCFEVVGGTTGRRYRIRHGDQMNVEQLDPKGRREQVLCFMPEGRLPEADVMLAQECALELFEDYALGVANKAPGLIA